MLLLAIFAALLLVAFLVAALLMRPPQGEQVVARRLAALQIVRPRAGAGTPAAEQSLLKEANAHRFVWLEELVERFAAAHRLRRLLGHANSRMSAGGLILWSAAAGFAGWIAAFVLSDVFALRWILAVAGACIPLAALKVKAARRLRAFNAALPDSIDLMARALRAGHSVASAIGVIAEEGAEPVASEFDALFKQQNFGLPFREALFEMAERVPSRDLRFLFTAMLVQKETGGNLTEILDRTTHVIRERLRIEGEVRVKTAQGRLTGWILASLPVIMLLLINVADPGYSHVLFSDPLGIKLIYAGIALIAIGGLIIRKIVRIEV